MTQSHVLIVGASVAGLACAACLQKRGIPFTIIEKEATVAAPWRHHYDRLHLHTNKSLSHLPYVLFGQHIPRYPSRQQVVDYLDYYQKEFNIAPLFNTTALSVRENGIGWLTETNNGLFTSRYVIVATGAFSKPKALNFAGADSFPGPLLHSFHYKTGIDFTGQKILVVGFGNSAAEIAMDLYEQGALPSMAVRSAVNVVPRDILGIPVLQLSLLLSWLPASVADKINAPLIRRLTGDITRLGLQQLPYGPLEQIQRDGNAPVLDIGTIKHIRKGNIKIHPGIHHISHNKVYFTDGNSGEYDAIIGAIGYQHDLSNFIKLDAARLADLRLPAGRQEYFGKDGLYFCGFWIASTGQIREIGLDAKRIAKSIAEK